MKSGELIRNFIVHTVHLHSQVIKSRGLSWAGHVPRSGEGRSASKILNSKLTGKRLSGKLWIRGEQIIKTGYKEIYVNVCNYKDSFQNRDS